MACQKTKAITTGRLIVEQRSNEFTIGITENGEITLGLPKCHIVEMDDRLVSTVQMHHNEARQVALLLLEAASGVDPQLGFTICNCDKCDCCDGNDCEDDDE